MGWQLEIYVDNIELHWFFFAVNLYILHEVKKVYSRKNREDMFTLNPRYMWQGKLQFDRRLCVRASHAEICEENWKEDFVGILGELIIDLGEQNRCGRVDG